MPQQLIYTSSPRGLVAGRSGFCTVARSDGMREALALRLEQLSYYEHRELAGGQEQPVCACRVVEIRGSRYHVLSRIQDAGLDFTNRTNFLAHHLAFGPEELPNLPLAPVIFRDWDGWRTGWRDEPRLLADEQWGNLQALTRASCIPAQNWAKLTGDAANALGLIDTVNAVLLNVDGLAERDVLGLFGESLEMLEARESAGDFKAGAWQITFTTCLQEQDPPGDFRWRCVSSRTPVFRKLVSAGQPVIPIRSVRAGRFTNEEALFAREGRQPLGVSCQPAAVRVRHGETVVLRACPVGVPPPNRFEWFACSRDGRLEQRIAEGTPELVLKDAPIGVSRIAVKVSNSRGESAVSRVAEVSVDPQVRLVNHPITGDSKGTPMRVPQPDPPRRVPKPGAEPEYRPDAEEFARHLQLVERNRKKRRNVIAATVCFVLAFGLIVFLVPPLRGKAHALIKKVVPSKTNKHLEQVQPQDPRANAPSNTVPAQSANADITSPPGEIKGGFPDPNPAAPSQPTTDSASKTNKAGDR